MSFIKIDERTFKFSLLVIEVYKHLTYNKEYILSKQLLRSATSVEQMLKKLKQDKVKLTLFLKWVLQVKKQEKVNIG